MKIGSDTTFDVLREGDDIEHHRNTVHEYAQGWWVNKDDDIPGVKEAIRYSNKRALKFKEPYVTPWFSTDAEDVWLKNMEEKPEIMADYGWADPDNQIIYNFNSNGFRDEELTDYDDCWLAVGECFTFGSGLHDENIWVRRVEKHFGTKIWNLAHCTTGFDYTFRVILGLLDELKPSKVLVLEPVPITREVYVDGKPEWPGDWSDDHWMRNIAGDKVERYVSRVKNYFALKHFLESRGVELVFVSSDERHNMAMQSWEEKSSGFGAAARDLMHPGNHFHELLLQHWKKKLGE
tara:strand:- start:15935 stop:16810 length:876 start_codon:yes stop_codon:yes gene_type:complete